VIGKVEGIFYHFYRGLVMLNRNVGFLNLNFFLCILFISSLIFASGDHDQNISSIFASGDHDRNISSGYLADLDDDSDEDSVCFTPDPTKSQLRNFIDRANEHYRRQTNNFVQNKIAKKDQDISVRVTERKESAESLMSLGDFSGVSSIFSELLGGGSLNNSQVFDASLFDYDNLPKDDSSNDTNNSSRQSSNGQLLDQFNQIHITDRSLLQSNKDL
jgi:hypothetical protein